MTFFKLFSAIKYMGNSGGKADGGVLLHVHGDQEELREGEGDREGRVVRLLDRGVKECRVIRPGEYHDSEQIHITDDQHSPYTVFSK